jgi:carbamate kinase
MSRYVVSLGGNALGNNAEEQKKLLVNVAEPIVALIKAGHEVIIVHGNGPQVGMINLAFAESRSTPDMPFPECGAMSKDISDSIYKMPLTMSLLSKTFRNTLPRIVNQVVVDEHDPLFQNPTKPVGAFYSKEEAENHRQGKRLRHERGQRSRISPRRRLAIPVDVVEKEMILSLIKDQHVVICAGRRNSRHR